jgi:hypothetical protein
MDLLPSSGRPIVAHICFLGNVFTESLPNNEYTRLSPSRSVT